MDYRTRMKLALGASLIIHIAVVGAIALQPPGDTGTSLARLVEPIVINLDRLDAPKRYVDTLVPTDEAVDPTTDLISEQNAKASSLTEGEGERQAPHFERPSEFDDLGGTEAVLIEPARSEPAPTPEPQKTVEETPAERTPPAEPEEPELAILDPIEPEERQPHEERFEMAKAETPPALPTHKGQPKGRVDGGVKSQGFLSFEAMEDEFAPYFKDVRNRVERRWRRALHLKYSGASKTKAVLDCAIRPDGQLAYVTIVEAGSSATYAHICKEAIEEAGPFSPFPFGVPEVYRNKNLEIRWSFSFM